MPSTKTVDQSELIQLALIGIDARIAELQATRAQLLAQTGTPSPSPAAKSSKRRKRRKVSAETRVKLSAAAQARWARERE